MVGEIQGLLDRLRFERNAVKERFHQLSRELVGSAPIDYHLFLRLTISQDTIRLAAVCPG